jgi:hypothetical protein
LQALSAQAVWACVLIALPIGTVLGWLGMIGMIVCVGPVVQAITFATPAALAKSSSVTRR